MAQKISAPGMERMLPETLMRSLLILMSCSARLLSLSGCRNNSNYPDGVVMPMSVVRGGSAAGQGGALAA
jgi:hypothetical protein